MENKVRCKKYAVYSNQNCITTLLVEMIRGEMAEILLDNILRLFSTETFGKDKSAYYVGGEKKLMNLIEAGKIESDKPTNVQNGKWHCNAAQVLLHCRCAGRKVKSKKRMLNTNILHLSAIILLCNIVLSGACRPHLQPGWEWCGAVCRYNKPSRSSAHEPMCRDIRPFYKS